MAAEVISAIEYDRSGDFLATGNKGGRLTIYSRNGSHASNVRLYDTHTAYSPRCHLFTRVALCVCISFRIR